MAFGRLHEEARSSPKLLALSDGAWRMWGCALIYTQDELTDGFIPEHVIHTFGVRAANKQKLIGELCRSLVAGKGPLWHEAPGGYQIHDYLHWNDSREDILRMRAGNRRRVAIFRSQDTEGSVAQQVRARDGDRCRYCGEVADWRDRRGLKGATYDHVEPDGPDTLENLVVSCRSCNSRKRDRTPEAAGMQLLPLQAVLGSTLYKDVSRSEPKSEPKFEGPQTRSEVGSLDGKPSSEPATGVSPSHTLPLVPRSTSTHTDPAREADFSGRRRPSLLAGTLPREHAPHAWCGDYRKCVPAFLHTEFVGGLGGDPAVAAERLFAFYARTMAAIALDAVISEAPPAFWRPRFSEAFPSTIQAPHSSRFQKQAGPSHTAVEPAKYAGVTQGDD